MRELLLPSHLPAESPVAEQSKCTLRAPERAESSGISLKACV